MINMESIKINQMVSKLKAQHQKEIDSWVGLYSTDELKLIKKVKKLKKELSDLKERDLKFYSDKKGPKSKLKILKEKKK